MILHTVRMGEGRPICLLHGLYGRHQNLLSVARHLAGARQVILMDLRNHGASLRAPGMAYDTMAEDVRATLASLGVGRLGLLGHSMGGKVAMRLALESPARVSHLIVGDIAPAAYAHNNGKIAAALQNLPLDQPLTRQAASDLLAPTVPDPGVRAFLLQNLDFAAPPHWRIGLDHIAAGIADIEGFAGPPPGARFEGPSLFLAGGRSDYITAAHHPIIRHLFPAAQISTVAGAGHWLHADQPAAFTGLIDNFLQSHPDI